MMMVASFYPKHDMRFSVIHDSVAYAIYRHASTIDINSKWLAFASNKKEALREFLCRLHSLKLVERDKREREGEKKSSTKQMLIFL